MAGPEGGVGSRWTCGGASGIATGSAERCTKGTDGGGVNAGAMGEWMPAAAGAGKTFGIDAAGLLVVEGLRAGDGSGDLSTESRRPAWGAAALTSTRSRGAAAGADCAGALVAADATDVADAVRLTIGAGSGVTSAAGVAGPACPEVRAPAVGWALAAGAGAKRSGSGPSLTVAGGVASTRRCTGWAAGWGPAASAAAA